MRNSAKRYLSFLGIWEGFGRSKAWFVVRLECFPSAPVSFSPDSLSLRLVRSLDRSQFSRRK